MYAVIESGGKQYRVKEGDYFYVEKLPGEKKSQIVIDQVLMVCDSNGPQLGSPLLEGAKVSCEVVEQYRGKKILVYKFKRRQKYRRRQGHRQNYTRLRVLEIASDGNLVGKQPEKKRSSTQEESVVAASQNESVKQEKTEPFGFESVALNESTENKE